MIAGSEIRLHSDLTSALLSIAVLLLAPSFLEGQIEIIRGQTLENTTSQPIAEVFIELLNNDLEVTKTVTSDSLGNFIFVAPGPGLYALRGTRLGYQNQMSLPLELSEGDQVKVDFRLSAQAILLDPLTVTVETPPEGDMLYMADFYDRAELYSKLGQGDFFTAEDIEPFTGMQTGLALGALSPYILSTPQPGRGMVPMMKNRGGSTIFGAGGALCEPAIFLDGVQIRGVEDIPLDALIMLQNVEAIEVYRDGLLNAPGEFMGLLEPGTPAACGIIVLWQKRRPGPRGR